MPIKNSIHLELTSANGIESRTIIENALDSISNKWTHFNIQFHAL